MLDSHHHERMGRLESGAIPVCALAAVQLKEWIWAFFTVTPLTNESELGCIPLEPGVDTAAKHLEPSFLPPVRLIAILPERASMDP
jgi:hypothetical protein